MISDAEAPQPTFGGMSEGVVEAGMLLWCWRKWPMSMIDAHLKHSVGWMVAADTVGLGLWGGDVH